MLNYCFLVRAQGFFIIQHLSAASRRPYALLLPHGLSLHADSVSFFHLFYRFVMSLNLYNDIHLLFNMLTY